jgi:hypothetical protein
MLVAAEIRTAARAAVVPVRWPWLIAFCFGCGTDLVLPMLADGLPHHAIPALLFFNLGVEAGQLAFGAVVLVAGWALQRTMASRLVEPAVVEQTVNHFDATATYAIGTVAAYWLIERTAAMFA